MAEKTDGFKLDLDLRLLGIWSALGEAPDMEMLKSDTGQIEILAKALRLAYVLGYQSALREDLTGDRAKLFTDHNVTPPGGTV